MQATNETRVKELLEFVYNNPLSDLYRTKFERAGFNPHKHFSSLADILKAPFITKEELTEAGPPLFVPETEVRHVSITSGTTGKPLVIRSSSYPETSDLLDNVGPGAVMLLGNPSLMSQLFARFIRTHRGGPVVMGDIRNLPATAEVAARVHTVMLSTIPTAAILFKKHAAAHPMLMQSLKYLRLGGETLTATRKRFIESLYPTVAVHAVYASAEAGRLGYQCAHLANTKDEVYYHVHTWGDTDEPLHHLEIVDPRGDGQVPFGGRGELILTNLVNRATPLIRYRTGDLVSFAPNHCACGARGPLLQVWGRALEDVVRAGGLELRRDMFEKSILLLQNEVYENFEVHVRERSVGEVQTLELDLHVSLRPGFFSTPALTKKVAEVFLAHTRISPALTLGEAVEKGLVEPIRVTYAALPQGEKTRGRILLH